MVLVGGGGVLEHRRGKASKAGPKKKGRKRWGSGLTAR
jgi:hypothetical protein